MRKFTLTAVARTAAAVSLVTAGALLSTLGTTKADAATRFLYISPLAPTLVLPACPGTNDELVVINRTDDYRENAVRPAPGDSINGELNAAKSAYGHWAINLHCDPGGWWLY